MGESAPGELHCAACGALGGAGDVVLDLGPVPAADDFPLPDAPVPDALHPLAMWLCPACGLAQLAEDDTAAEEPLAVEPQALRDQAAIAVDLVTAAYPGARSVVEFGSPHGGSWLSLLRPYGWLDAEERADVVVDTFGLMHEPDQAAAIRERADRLADDGVLLLLFHSLATIVEQGQWSSLRHGHTGYYSLTALGTLLGQVGLAPATVWEFDLYGGTVLLAASRDAVPDEWVSAMLEREARIGVTDATALRSLQQAADAETDALAEALAGGSWYAYGAASRAVAVLHRAGATPDRLLAVADASPGKQGRTMPGTRVPIVSPTELVAADPERVWLLLPDLAREVGHALPSLEGRWAAPC
ncbi:methyltransferase domain-containing protein [Nocardioides mangrovicus]|uniref:Methyltransferase domain-containing protein n=1 Tax=Nocardioides mangrovicus TaxID=2478913 RepID=A0A3L8NZI7_9ACTN|nr:methyltransferase domain-containing protein [Nocardioides mangrovicus]RLV48616.1 methyltransferase domain-containing protein [Nocardioides mangrovicus]